MRTQPSTDIIVRHFFLASSKAGGDILIVCDVQIPPAVFLHGWGQFLLPQRTYLNLWIWSLQGSFESASDSTSNYEDLYHKFKALECDISPLLSLARRPLLHTSISQSLIFTRRGRPSKDEHTLTTTLAQTPRSRQQ